jgi:hypothetical protein
MTTPADRALSQPSPETSATGALTDIQLWELLPKRLEQNLLAMVQIAAPHHNLKPIDLLQSIAPDLVDYARAVLKAKPQVERPSEKDLYDLAAEPPAAGCPTPPAPETPAEALAVCPLLEKVAAMASHIGAHTVGEIAAISSRAEAWLRDNPPGQPVAIEPRGCPTPGACSCVGPTSQAPEDLATDQLMAANLSALLIKECGLHSPGSSAHALLQRAAAMLVNYGLPARPATPPAPQAGEVARPTFQDAIRLAQGCHDYSGGHTGAEGVAWHGAIDTVVGVLRRAAVGPWDSQTRAVFGVGVEAQAGEVSVPVAELDDQRREAVYQAVAEALGSGAYDCLRVWSAWSCGTMGPDDFVPVAKDDDRVAEIADAAIEAIRAIPAPQAGEVGELVALLKIAGRWATSTGVHLDRFAALFDQQAAELATLRGVPVAVSERRPEAKDCLFNEGATIGKCWCFNPELEGVPWWSFEPLEWAENATHWLPCNAIPLPRLGRWRCEAENTHSSNS